MSEHKGVQIPKTNESAKPLPNHPPVSLKYNCLNCGWLISSMTCSHCGSEHHLPHGKRFEGAEVQLIETHNYHRL